MDLFNNRAPEGGLSLAHDALGDVSADPPAKSSPIANAQRLLISEPHRTFGIGARILVERRLLGAEHTGWRYIVADADNALAAIHVQHRSDGQLFVAGVNESPLVQASVDALAKAEETASDGDRYEVRLLEILPIHFVALWLVGSERAHLVPLTPGLEGLEAMQMVREPYAADWLVIAASRVLGEDAGER